MQIASVPISEKYESNDMQEIALCRGMFSELTYCSIALFAQVST